jgi:tetratricopeptide (TPR) repeat protein
MTSSRSDQPNGAVGVPLIWGNVPQRNKNFTGRSELINELRNRIVAQERTALVPRALYGLGGVGKTQLAIEYAYRFASQYQIVWWIRADQPPLVRTTLASLASRLDIEGPQSSRVEDTMSAVLDALRLGKPYDRWLLVYDNADELDEIRSLIPAGHGHVIVTSRDRGWAGVADALEIDVFKRVESKELLRLRVPGISDGDAERLAEEFGDLPLGLEQAAAWLSETATAPSAYLDQLAAEGSRILAEGPASSDYPLPVAAAWSLSVMKLRTQTPDAMELLQCCAFFGPAPIPLELLDRGRYVLDSPLQATLKDQILLGRAIRALGRYALARIDNHRRTIEVHRVIQRIIRDELDDDTRTRLKHEVHMLLHAADPGKPDEFENWPKYEELLAHTGSADFVSSKEAEARQLIQNIVRYLYSSGNYNSALDYADDALKKWTADSGPDDRFVLIMNRLKVQVLQALARYREAYDLSRHTLDRMIEVLGEDHEETLIMMNCRCIDLWARGEFADSLKFTKVTAERHVEILGTENARTFAAMNNYAEDLLLNGRYKQARELNEQIYKDKLDFYGRDDYPRVLFTLDALGRTMMAEGRYADALVIAERANDGFAAKVREHVLTESHPWVLEQVVDLSVAKRTAGDITGALKLAEDAHVRYRQAYFSEDHPRALAAAANLGNTLRLAGHLEAAVERLDNTARRYRTVFGRSHPYALATTVNLAIARRKLGQIDEARTLLAEAAQGFKDSLGQEHHHSIICLVEIASDEAQSGDLKKAVQLGGEARAALVVLLGEDHPHTLACSANLGLDLKAAGEKARGEKMRAEAIERLRQTLGNNHPNVLTAVGGQRIDLGIEVYATF